MLKQTFTKVIEMYSADTRLIDELWNEIKDAYSKPKRFYHTLNHLENVLTQLVLVKNNITDWDTVLFTLFYHDVIYKSSRTDNEEQSAILAEKRMKQLSISEDIIQTCKKHILATKRHLEQLSSDTN